MGVKDGPRRIKARRGELDMRTQQALADAAGVSVATVSRLERGLPVGVAYQARIEDALGWAPGSIERIFAGAEPTETRKSDANASDHAAEMSDHSPHEGPDPADFDDDLAYFDAVYWYQRGLGYSHASVILGLRMATAAYLRRHPDDAEIRRIIDDH